MSDKTGTTSEASAEKAYAAATENAATVPAVAQPAVAQPPSADESADAAVQFPAKGKRQPKAPVASAKTASKPAKAKARPVATAKPAARPQAASPAKTARKAATPKTSVFQQIKDKTMDNTEFTTKMKSAVADVQEKAKEAFDKGAAAFGEYNEFTKGNLEAVVESSKILAAGMQSLGTTFVADSKTAFETLTAEAKELASVKSPTDFFKLQVELMRRNFDTAVAYTSKNSEAVLKLASDVAAPISGRVSLAVEKVKKAA